MELSTTSYGKIREMDSGRDVNNLRYIHAERVCFLGTGLRSALWIERIPTKNQDDRLGLDSAWHSNM
jgi:hypothetical protein